MVGVDIGILANEPDKNFNIFLTPVFFDSLVLDHSKLSKVVLFDSDVDDFSDHVRTDVKIVVFLVFYIGFAMG